ncbi:hypothetical protein Dimus_011340 [Dionaea muscipula]
MSEQKAFVESSFAVSEMLNSASGSTSRIENLLEVVNADESYAIYKFDPSSCIFIDGNGRTHVVDLEDLEASKPDKFSPFAAKFIDGINRSELKRRALVIFCLVYLDVNVRVRNQSLLLFVGIMLMLCACVHCICKPLGRQGNQCAVVESCNSFML